MKSLFVFFPPRKKSTPDLSRKLVSFIEERGFCVTIENSTHSSSMEPIHMETWEEFEERANRIVSDTRRRRNKIHTPLFRGHSNEEWKLETTLERYSKNAYTLIDYHRIIKIIKPTVESLTSHCWSIPEFDENDKELREDYVGPPPGYEFMIYLRHHGFPSPLLDWTQSPYIAAFFAFEEAREKKNADLNVAIYCYQEGEIPGKKIIRLGPTVRTHERHFLQQSEYTICKTEIDSHYRYSNHEEILSGKNVEDEGSFTKFTIPFSEREKVLKKLDLMNINAHSLFGNQEGLMKTLAFREIVR